MTEDKCPSCDVPLQEREVRMTEKEQRAVRRRGDVLLWKNLMLTTYGQWLRYIAPFQVEPIRQALNEAADEIA